MNKLLYAISLVLVTINVSIANHFSGAELTYECLGDNGNNTSSYEITLTVYRDCGGQDYQSTYIVDYNSGCNTAIQNLTLTAVGIAQEITPLCPGDVTKCTDIGSAYMEFKKEHIKV